MLYIKFKITPDHKAPIGKLICLSQFISPHLRWSYIECFSPGCVLNRGQLIRTEQRLKTVVTSLTLDSQVRTGRSQFKWKSDTDRHKVLNFESVSLHSSANLNAISLLHTKNLTSNIFNVCILGLIIVLLSKQTNEMNSTCTVTSDRDMNKVCYT